MLWELLFDVSKISLFWWHYLLQKYMITSACNIYGVKLLGVAYISVFYKLGLKQLFN